MLIDIVRLNLHYNWFNLFHRKYKYNRSHVMPGTFVRTFGITTDMFETYARENMLIPNFKHCMTGVKITLFKTYCSSLYCCPMWTKYRKSTIGKANVAFNKVFKVFMNVPSSFSPSWLFLICDVLNFPPLRRKLVLSIMKRIKKSSNVLISNSYNFLMTNVMQRCWNKLLI